jgi:flagellar hook-associated protein 2
MSTPLSSVQGLASSVQWQDLVSAIMAQQKARMLDPVTNAITAAKSGVTAWTSFQSLVKTFDDAAVALRDGAIGSVAAAGGTTASGRALLSATTASGATPGSYQAEVLSLARATKVAGATVSSSTTALGFTGEFFVNGKRIAVTATDTLTNIRDRINAANVGSGATGVTATLNSSAGGVRLVLNASATGASGIELADGSAGVLQQLGLVDGTAASVGAQTQTYRFANSTTAIGTLLGTTDLPAATTITVGNATINVDLSTDTLADIQQRIAATGVGARLTTESFNGTNWQRIAVDEAAGATPGDADSARVLSLLGFTQPGQSSVAQVLADSSPWTDAGGAVATTSTALTSLSGGGTALGLAAGDSIQINGVRGDGMPVSATLTLDGSETVDTLLAKLNDPSVFGSVSRPATASLGADGTLLLTDGTAGGSQLALSLSVKRANGGTASFGRVATQTVGMDRVLVQGSDAQVRIDGTTFFRSSNTITDVIPNVTLNLSAAEPGTTVDLTLSRDVTAASNAAQTLATSYNALVDFVKTQTASGGALAFSSTLRSALRQISLTIQQDVPGLTGTLTRGALVGLAVDKTGHLQLDQAKFTAALQSRSDDVLALFGSASVVQADGTVVKTTGLGGALATLADSMSRAGDGLAAEHISILQQQTDVLSARADDIQARLDRHQETLTAQFVTMESVLARLQSQSATLGSQIKSLQSSTG